MRNLRNIAAVLLIIGGINWGLVGLFQFDLVASVFGGTDGVLSRIIYALVGASAVYLAFTYPWSRATSVVERHEERPRKAA